MSSNLPPGTSDADIKARIDGRPSVSLERFQEIKRELDQLYTQGDILEAKGIELKDRGARLEAMIGQTFQSIDLDERVQAFTEQLGMTEEGRVFPVDVEAVLERAIKRVEKAKEIWKNLQALLKNVGGSPGKCRGCPEPIYWITHDNGEGAKTPYNRDGTNHFITCPERERFRTRKKKDG